MKRTEIKSHEITVPLSDDQLATARGLVNGGLPEGPGALQAAVETAEELLGEVDRLRALLATVRTNQTGLSRAYAEASKRGDARAGTFTWTPSHSAAYAQGEARGAIVATMFLLMELGEVEYDEAAETTWELVMSDPTTKET